MIGLRMREDTSVLSVQLTLPTPLQKMRHFPHLPLIYEINFSFRVFVLPSIDLMFQKFYSPHPALKGIINNVMIVQGVFDSKHPLPVLPMPQHPEQRLFFYPYDPVDAHYFLSNKKIKLSPAIVVGPHIERLNVKLGVNHLVIKVGFQPGALHRVLSIPMTKLLQTEAFNAADLFGSEIHMLTEQIRNADSFDAMKGFIDLFFMEQLRKVRSELPIDSSLQYLVEQKGAVSIDALAKQACLSTRQFERIFKDRIGFTPKYYARMVRFAHAWELKERNPNLNWTNIAHATGYFDQMHFIKDFKEFSGTTPGISEEDFRKLKVLGMSGH